MLYTIKNDALSVTINDHGAELWSILSNDGTEYLWQGDPQFWSGHSPNLFPYIGRMINKEYEYKSIVRPMQIHGLALYSDFTVTDHSASSISFALHSCPESLKQYPWDFIYTITYTLQDNCLQVSMSVTNLSNETMLFAVGGHPGFRVPLEEGLQFSDYRLRFHEDTHANRVIFTSDCFTDHLAPYSLAEGNFIPLRHDLFDNDAIVLQTQCKTVTLESIRGSKHVTVSYPDMDYIGFWHMPKKECPYICIEPWSSLPSQKGKKTVWENQADLLKLASGKRYNNTWSITIE